MTRDYTLYIYRRLLEQLLTAGYRFCTFEQYCAENKLINEGKLVVLRHDVDKRPQNSLETARIEHELGITASYYFRIVEESNQPKYIRAIAALGHEIGYHYENLSLANGNIDQAIKSFAKNIEYFRQFYPVRTICMHGAPRSPWDSRDIWKGFDYHNFGVIGEPYFDMDFSQMFYLTDTGRRWDGYRVSLRDKIPVYQDMWVMEGLVYHSTQDLIAAIDMLEHPETQTDYLQSDMACPKCCNSQRFHLQPLPKRLMMTTHPQRWTDDWYAWCMEYAVQSAKNVVKYWLARVRG